ncbi:MAG: DUF3343 domain-containing protein [Armatimonadota bacterium]|nr:DUF3343 domain-containing protein [Armatimonadota bacterium]MCX7776704.1 DUF3343 domain-containing protein [Armatimonadota bacterium]MDW8026342.1 DUF3343 domain-containing protein [Armatimonadota bacterium]
MKWELKRLRGLQMDTTSFCVITFPTTSHVLHAEELLKANGIQVELIPVPRAISSDCAISIKLNCAQKEEALKLLQANSIAYEGVHIIEQSHRKTFLGKLFGSR